ncbi:O-methyltransferase COMT-type [Trema orientale]|uniref:O-methyltransferase COMT-type n=1 Tax=Trema orientale TaxID=63057 RepID=A0A2P5FN94_TREOI|nr:O-methyltransferase COMT-type [Trema orientale]
MDCIQGQGSNELFKAQSHLYKYVLCYLSSMSLKCAVQLGIADIINSHGRLTTFPELVFALQIHTTKTGLIHRLMRLLTHLGFFTTTKVGGHYREEDQEDAYDLTPSSRLLLKDKLPNLSPFVLAALDPASVTPCHFLTSWICREGAVRTPFESTTGVNFWDYTNDNSEFNNVFNEAMASDSETINLVVKDCKPVFEGLSSLVDVGGGTGKTAGIITEAFPHLTCTVLDLPHVVANLADTGNLKFIGADMFQHIPPADACVLHDWSDEECLKILKKCKEAIPSNGKGKLIIIDVVLNDNTEDDDHDLTEAKLYFDFLMMVLVTGRERSEKDLKKLFLGARFSHYKITPMFGLRSLIEVFR